jgi:hypothetical protein
MSTKWTFVRGTYYVDSQVHRPLYDMIGWKYFQGDA